MIRCSRCCYPSTKPDIAFVDGVCSACLAFDDRQKIDWAARMEDFKQVLADTKRAAGGWSYTCVVPSSGGKDSTYQTIRMLELGQRPLVVTAATDLLSDIGRRNIDNLSRFADTIEVRPNTTIRRKLCRIAMNEVGDLSWPEHSLIWSVPFQVAVAKNIPLIVYGENPQSAYGGPLGTQEATQMTARWRSEFGGFLGLRVSDLVGREGIRGEDMEPYMPPSDTDLARVGVKAVWLGQYEDWDGYQNALRSREHGFEWLDQEVEQSIGEWENLDNLITVPRDWLRFCKYGYGRATDIASSAIRRGRMTRDEALKKIAERERFPWTSLGVPLRDVLCEVGVTTDDYIAACDRFTNPAIFKFVDGKPVKDADGTPVFK